MSDDEARDADGVRTRLLQQYHDGWERGDLREADRAAYRYRHEIRRLWRAGNQQRATDQLSLFEVRDG